MNRSPLDVVARAPRVEILSQGDEVVTGQTVDTNAAWLATRLTELGFDVVRHTSVGDRLPDLQALFTEVADRCDLAICTGGLGPTDDDLTAGVAAQVFSMPLALDSQAEADLRAKYARYARVMPEVNVKQAWLPTGSIRIDNDWGTAPGFAIQASRAFLVFLPGVPREMRNLFDHRVLPMLHERFPIQAGRLVTLRTTGVGESDLQERIGSLDSLPEAIEHGVVLAYRTMLPENHVKLRFPAGTDDAAVQRITAEVARRIRTPLFSVEGAAGAVEGVDDQGGDLATVVGRALTAAGLTLAVAESCTGGLVAASCTSIPGSSAWFLEGAVTYGNQAKVRMLGVDPGALEAHGAVSEPVARQMAEGVRDRAGATWGLSTTGIAGPTGGSDEKPVGTVHIAAAGPAGTEHLLLRLSGDRVRIQKLAAAAVIDLLRRHLFTTSASNASTGA